MNAYLPHSMRIVDIVAALVLATLIVGFGITRLPVNSGVRWLAWGLAVVSVACADRVSTAEPAGFRMFSIITVLFTAMKTIVTVESYSTGERPLSPASWFAFAAGWFGMRPSLFAAHRKADLPGAWRLVRFGLVRLAFGVILIWCASLIWPMARRSLGINAAHVLATLCLLPGLSLMLHFGLLNIAAGLWRTVGIDCRPLFREPTKSVSLTEFWGRRWNLAFSEMTALGIYRPLRSVIGQRGATLAAFLASGVLHELAISVPVHAGYGLPILYFLLQGLLQLYEQGPGKAMISRMPLRGRIWTIGCVLLPVPILFHPWFLRGVVWPIIGM